MRLGNCAGNGDPDISVFNIAAGFINGAGNANSNPFGLSNGPSSISSLQHLAWNSQWQRQCQRRIYRRLTAIPDGGGAATNISAFNFEAGIANGAGNANVIIAPANQMQELIVADDDG